MSKFVVINKENFLKICSVLKTPDGADYDYLYDVYKEATEGIEELTSNNHAFAQVESLNPLEIIQYTLGEYLYSSMGLNDKQKEDFIHNEDVKDSMASVVADKYLSLAKFEHKERKLTSKYFPPISSLSLYVNFMLTIVNSYQRKDPTISLIADLLFKSLSIMKCSIGLLVDGFETTAFSAWRTLHECECTLLILDKYKKDIINRYLLHMNYGMAFRNLMEDKDKQTEIFMHMKEEMKQYNLKSKDIKKYIEYGWLYAIDEVKNNPDFKLNFRDGLEKVAGLENYNSRYDMSSEIIHSTPMLIYSNREYFHFVTILSLYESFFRLEKVFVSLFVNRVGKEAIDSYKKMRDIYYSQLVNIHKRETRNFANWSKKHEIK